jgi:hypothetical protein
MPEADYAGMDHWRTEQEKRLGRLRSGGGGGTFDPMEPRVAALEKAFERMDSKLDILISDVSYMKGKFEGLPTAINFGELKGRVDSLPTTAKIAGLIAIGVGFLTLVAKWSDFIALFHR